MIERPEVLAPAGDRAAMDAAIAAGADAVYFGLGAFNARARATNFEADALNETLAHLHARQVRGYVALNTLVFDDELADVEAAIRACARAGVDALIVQDLGVARLARALAPELPLHASTQMTCTDASSVELARELGARRVVLARELSLADIAAIRAETDVELEVFVHGALCVAYSGQCLTSEALGGRSANRGACAQACRLPYDLLVDGTPRALGDRAHLLSPEDLEASALVRELAALGVRSLKIEGRLKGPEYVAATTRLYRAAVDALVLGGSDALAPSGDDAHDHDATLARLRNDALQTYSRGSGPGFLRGVDHQRLVPGETCDHVGLRAGLVRGVVERGGRRWLDVALERRLARGDGVLAQGRRSGEGELGGRVWALELGGRDVTDATEGRALVWLGPDRALPAQLSARTLWKTDDPAVDRAVTQALTVAPHRRPIDVRLEGVLGAPARLSARTDRGLTAEVMLDADTVLATRRPTSEEALRDAIGALGGSPFSLRSLSFALPEGALVPLSAVKQARRALLEALVRHASHEARADLAHTDLREGARPPSTPPPPGGLFVLARNEPQARAALEAGAAGVLLDFLALTGAGATLRALRAAFPERTLGLAPPRIRKPGEEKIDRYLAAQAPDVLLVRGLGALRAPEASDALRVGDFSLNVTNALSAAEVLSRGLGAFTPSFDLDARQLLALVRSPFGPYAEVVLHHPMPLFHMEHCVFAALLSEGRDHRDCGRPCERHEIALRDRAGVAHPVEADVGCRNTVFHGAAQSAAGLVPSLLEAGVRRFRVELVRESPADVSRIVAAYRALLDGARAPGDVWRELRTEGGYGVVRGSLRVLS